MKKSNFKVFIFFISIFCTLSQVALSQQVVVDKIVAVIGNSIIKESDIQNQYQQLKREGYPVGEMTSCKILEDVMYQKLLIDQAAIDSIEVTESNVDDEIQRRIDEYAEQIGSYEKLEKFYEKSILEIKTEWREIVREQILAQRMQQKLVADIKVSPQDVRVFFQEMTKDSLPLINPQYELAQIEISPRITPKQKLELRRRLDEIRERAIKGENFSSLAVLYSDDLASAKKGGDLGYVSRGELVSEFAATAFKLKDGEISRIVETEYGFHIIKMMDRKGERINVRHILIKPKPTSEDFQLTKRRADSIYAILKTDTISFKKVALLYSDDKNTKNNGGLLVNPYTGDSKFSLKQVDPLIFYNVENLKVGEFSKPFLSTDNSGNQVYRIAMMVSKTDAHKASLTEDYQLIKEMTLDNKKNTTLKNWVKKKQDDTYIKIEPEYRTCEFEHDGWLK